MTQLRSTRGALVAAFPLPATPVLLTPATEELAWFEPVPDALLDVVAVAFPEGVVVLFGVTAFFASFAACWAWVAAEGSVRTRVAVLAFGTAFCVASFASCGVTPMAVAGAGVVAEVWAQAPPAANANVAHKAHFFIE